MKIATWNMGYWLYRSQHDAAWEHLLEEMRPDVALVQETRPVGGVGSYSAIYQETHHGWGVAVLSSGGDLTRVPLEAHPNRAVLTCLNGLYVASVHAHSDPVFPHLREIIDEILNITGGERTIVGGDFNTARLAREVWPGWGHGQFWAWIDSGEELVDSYRLFHESERQTFFCDGGVHAFQDDHILVTPDLAPRVTSAQVMDHSLTRRLSDHVPVVSTLSTSSMSR